MSKQTIWQFLKHKGFSNIAAAALMGNMEAESNCVSCRVQGDFTNGFNPAGCDPVQQQNGRSDE